MGNVTKADYPSLKTQRLNIAPLRPRDAETVFGAIEGSRVQLRKWLPFTEVTHASEDTRAFILRTRRSAADHVWGIWEPEPSGNGGRGAFCGNIGLHGLSVQNGTGTLGYWMRTRCAGRGYMTEACAAVLLWLFDELGLARVAVEAATGNRASIRVIEKLGFTHEGVLRSAQAIPTRRRRLDWNTYSLIRRDLRQVRPRLRVLCGSGRPWEK